MAKITKSQLQKQNAEMQNKILELMKENTELKVKVQFYENLPQNVSKVCGDAWGMICNAAFPPQKQEQSKQ